MNSWHMLFIGIFLLSFLPYNPHPVESAMNINADSFRSLDLPKKCTNLHPSSSNWVREYHLWISPAMTQNTGDGGGIILGNYDYLGDVVLLKITASGDTVWSWNLRGISLGDLDYFQEMSDGGFILTGDSYSSSTRMDLAVLRLDAYGNILWHKMIATSSPTSTELGLSILETPDGGYLISGKSNSFDDHYEALIIKLDHYGNIVWQKLLRGGDFSKMIWLPDGSILLGGNTYIVENAGVWLVNISSEGNIIWQKSYTYLGGSGFMNMQLTLENEILIAGRGYSSQANNYYSLFIKLYLEGNIIWDKMIGDVSNRYTPYAILEGPDGTILIAGEIRSSDGELIDAWLLNLDHNGEVLRQITFGLDELDYARSINLTSDGVLYIVGGLLYTDHGM